MFLRQYANEIYGRNAKGKQYHNNGHYGTSIQLQNSIKYHNIEMERQWHSNQGTKPWKDGTPVS